MSAGTPPPLKGRIDIIDVARGTAMLLVFVSHFADALFGTYAPAGTTTIQLLTRIATPSFVWISGVTLAVLYARKRERFGEMRDRLIDRGLFLILVGHPLFTIAHRFMVTSWVDAIRTVFITDTVGAAVIIGALLITRIGPRARATIGVALLLTAWVLTVAWLPPLPGVGWRVKDFLVGDLRDHWLDYNFPIVPWLGVYLIASAAGTVFAEREVARQNKFLAPRLALIGSASMALSLGIRQGCQALIAYAPAQATALSHLGALTHKLPPSPTYLFFYAGLALMMFAVLLALRQTRAGHAFQRWVALFGRYSFAAFLFQFYVYYVAVRLLPQPPPILLPLYFIATMALIRVLVALWHRLDGNRVITIGYAAFARRWFGGAPVPGPGAPLGPPRPGTPSAIAAPPSDRHTATF
jgi:uncharacterized membrane protein